MSEAENVRFTEDRLADQLMKLDDAAIWSDTYTVGMEFSREGAAALADLLERAEADRAKVKRAEANRDMYRDAIDRVEEVLDDSDHEPSCHYLNTPFDAADQSCDCIKSRIWAAIGGV